MLIIGCDYHPGFQQIAFVDSESGELGERCLIHPEEAQQFYSEPKQRKLAVRVGMEASGHGHWFERLLRDLQFELWIGDAAEIRSKRVRKRKTDREDARLLLRLMMEDRFPRIWVPDAANRDMRQLLWHRHRLVQMRTRVMNQLHVIALNEGVRRKKALWRAAGRKEPESIALVSKSRTLNISIASLDTANFSPTKAIWTFRNTLPAEYTNSISTLSMRSSNRERSGACQTRSLLHSRNWSRSLNSRRRPGWASFSNPGSRSPSSRAWRHRPRGCKAITGVQN